MTESRSSISMKDLKDKYASMGKDQLVLDVRTPEEFAEAHVPGAKNIDHEQVDRHVNELQGYKEIYLHCRSGKRAAIAADSLRKRGLSNIVLVKDTGMADWLELGYPVVRGAR